MVKTRKSQAEDRRATILAYVQKHYEETKIGTTYQDISNATGIPMTTVSHHVRVLQSLGKLTLQPFTSRSIIPVK